MPELSDGDLDILAKGFEILTEGNEDFGKQVFEAYVEDFQTWLYMLSSSEKEQYIKEYIKDNPDELESFLEIAKG